MNEKEQFDSAKWILEKIHGGIGAADSKAGALIAIDTAMLAALAVVYTDAEHITAWATTFSVLTMLLVAAATVCCAVALNPRTDGPTSMIFWGKVAVKTYDEYAMQFQALTLRSLLDDCIRQIHRNAQIAHDKHIHVRRAVNISFIAAIPWLTSVCLLLQNGGKA